MVSVGSAAFSFSLTVAVADRAAQAPDGSLSIAGSVQGRIWRVIYTGK